MTDEERTKAGVEARAHDAGDDTPAVAPRRRMSAGRKQEAVLRILRGEDLELVSREFGVTAADLSGWRDSFLAAGTASLKSRPEDGRDRELRAMRESCPSKAPPVRARWATGDLTMANELLETKIGRLEAGLPLVRRRSRR